MCMSKFHQHLDDDSPRTYWDSFNILVMSEWEQKEGDEIIGYLEPCHEKERDECDPFWIPEGSVSIFDD
jgi:hypothetical protein